MENNIPPVVAVLGKENYLTEVSSGKHVMHADEPLDKGGKDVGPSPSQYISAALASCAAITIRMYVERKEWEIGQIKVSVKHEKNYF